MICFLNVEICKKIKYSVFQLIGLWILLTISAVVTAAESATESASTSNIQCAIADNKQINPTVITSMIEAANRGELYRVDTNTSNVGFQVNHFPFSSVEGHFSDFQGGVTVPVDGNLSRQALFLIKVDSVTTGDTELDDYIKSSAFFDAIQFPDIIFISTAFERIDHSTARLYGELTLRGTTKPLVFIAHIVSNDNYKIRDNKNMIMLASAEIKRSEFGMHEMQLFISDSVRFSIKIEASRVGL